MAEMKDVVRISERFQKVDPGFVSKLVRSSLVRQELPADTVSQLETYEHTGYWDPDMHVVWEKLYEEGYQEADLPEATELPSGRVSVALEKLQKLGFVRRKLLEVPGEYVES